jgi:hypothetical protein
MDTRTKPRHPDDLHEDAPDLRWEKTHWIPRAELAQVLGRQQERCASGRTGFHRAAEPEPTVELEREAPGEQTTVIPATAWQEAHGLSLPYRHPGAAAAQEEETRRHTGPARLLAGLLRAVPRGFLRGVR